MDLNPSCAISVLQNQCKQGKNKSYLQFRLACNQHFFFFNALSFFTFILRTFKEQ